MPLATSHTVVHPAELLAFLFESYPDVKRTKVRQWLKHGSVRVNGLPVTRTNHPLRSGDTVSIRAKSEVQAEALLPPGLRVIYEDEALVVIDKPENLLSIASATERHQTAYAFLTNYVRHRSSRSAGRVWIVHRLDRESSGVMVFAKTETAKRSLQAHWHDAEKKYLAVVEGAPPADRGTLRSHLDESRAFKVHRARSGENSRHAVTHYRVVKRAADRTLVELTLETGRRNQIRVHLGPHCPIVGDRKYGARTDPAGRLGLHSSSLALEHPVSGERLSFESPLPKSLVRLL